MTIVRQIHYFKMLYLCSPVRNESDKQTGLVLLSDRDIINDSPCRLYRVLVQTRGCNGDMLTSL